ncbi:hypothetical protein PVAP13_3KG422202 [Panicum virgatum]|uniref:Uncharacterized protein n=1 Tax=Panicum virgatum TaxID=38727 RepID=A0A8T0V4N7_PANVG|nr:hypothetical protein PVAP13_3KG422202 [Panicum virgatum]
MEASPLRGGQAAACPQGRRSPPRRDPWRRISHPMQGESACGRSPARPPSPWRQRRPPRPVASGWNGGALGSRIREVGPPRHRLSPPGEGEGEGETQICQSILV